MSGVAVVGVVAACAYLALSLANGTFYTRRHQLRLGFGRSRVIVPEGPAGWLNEHPLQGRILLDYITSSNLYFLLDEPRPEASILTNGWAFPPEVLTENMGVYTSFEKLRAFVDRHDVSAVVYRLDRLGGMLKTFRERKDWSLVYLDGAHAIFMPLYGPDVEVAKAEALTPLTWDANAFIQRAKEREIAPGYAIGATGSALVTLRWTHAAVRVLEEGAKVDPTYPPIWRDLAYALMNRSAVRQANGDRLYLTDVERAIEMMAHAQTLEDDPTAREHLAEFRQRLMAERARSGGRP